MTAYMTELWRLRHFWMAWCVTTCAAATGAPCWGWAGRCCNRSPMTVVLCTRVCRRVRRQSEGICPYLLSGLTFWNFISATAITAARASSKANPTSPAPAPRWLVPVANDARRRLPLPGRYGRGFRGRQRSFRLPQPAVLLSLVPSLILCSSFAWSLPSARHAQCALPRPRNTMLDYLLQSVLLTPIITKPRDLLIKRDLAGCALNPLPCC